ncbi:MAG TPA: hypothetical protein VFB38_24275 [Chthonomonadaceae bacterium]|nr:hypothetical protein [Chthonomonadaceae bacterium]
MLTHLPERLSPLHDALEHLHPHWGQIEGMPVPLDFGDPAAERNRVQTLALCDVSALARLVLKGKAAESFLKEQGVGVPEAMFHCLPLPGGGLIARTGSAEFFLEEGLHGDTLPQLDQALGPGRAGIYRVLRQDAALLLSGSQVVQVLLQTCGYDFRQADSRLVLTRIAGVSCAVLPRELNGLPVFQLWLDGSYGMYLWETLLPIVGELGGGVAGLSCFFTSERV